MGPSIIIPKSQDEIRKQIKALEYIIPLDTNEKDKQIHKKALNELKAALK